MFFAELEGDRFVELYSEKGDRTLHFSQLSYRVLSYGGWGERLLPANDRQDAQPSHETHFTLIAWNLQQPLLNPFPSFGCHPRSCLFASYYEQVGIQVIF